MSTVPAGTTYTERSFPLSGGVKTNEAQQSPGNQAALDRVSSAGQMTEGTSNVPGDSFGYHTHSEKPHEGYVHHTSGPHASDIGTVKLVGWRTSIFYANRLYSQSARSPRAG